MSFTSSSIWFGRTHKGLLGAVAAVALGLAGCGGGSDEPDARIPGGGNQPDAGEPTHSGTVSLTDVTALDEDGNPFARGGSVSISFTENVTFDQCAETSSLPCQIGESPIGSCLTRVLPAGLESAPTVDVGQITITAATASATSDSGVGDESPEDEWNPAPEFPICSIRDGQYACISLEGTGGLLTPTGGGVVTFATYDIGDGGTDNNEEDITRTLIAITNDNLNSLPIVGVGPGVLVGLSGTLLAPVNVDVWRVVHGGGPTPLGVPSVESYQFLNDSDRLTINVPGSEDGPFGEVEVTVNVGDVFTLTPDSQAFFAKLDDQGAIGTTTAGAGTTLGCADCGNTSTAGNAAGTLIVLDATTADEHIIIQCSALGMPSATIPADHWARVKAAAMAGELQTLQVSVFRPGLSQSPTTELNSTNFLAGHGFVRRLDYAE